MFVISGMPSISRSAFWSFKKQREKYGIELSQAACDKIAKVCCFNCTSKQVDVGKRMQMVNEGICDTVSEILIAKIEWG